MPPEEGHEGKGLFIAHNHSKTSSSLIVYLKRPRSALQWWAWVIPLLSGGGVVHQKVSISGGGATFRQPERGRGVSALRSRWLVE